VHIHHIKSHSQSTTSATFGHHFPKLIDDGPSLFDASYYQDIPNYLFYSFIIPAININAFAVQDLALHWYRPGE